MAIDFGVIAICAFLYRQDVKAGERRLERMSRGARIARLRVEDVGTRQVRELKELRGEKRVIVVAGSDAGVRGALESAAGLREEFEEVGLVVVPFVTSNVQGASVSAAQQDLGRAWRYAPFAPADWAKWFETERSVVKAKLGGDGSVVVIVIRLDGRVGARSTGTPVWSRLVEEVRRLPAKDQYGRP